MIISMERKCDFCGSKAIYDAPSTRGSWAYFCQRHYEIYGNQKFPPTVLADIEE